MGKNEQAIPAAYQSMYPFLTTSVLHEMQIENSHHHLHP